MLKRLFSVFLHDLLALSLPLLLLAAAAYSKALQTNHDTLSAPKTDVYVSATQPDSRKGCETHKRYHEKLAQLYASTGEQELVPGMELTLENGAFFWD